MKKKNGTKFLHFPQRPVLTVEMEDETWGEVKDGNNETDNRKWT